MEQALANGFKDKAIYYGRWLGLLPASVFGAWVAYLGIRFLNSFGASHFLDPDSFMYQLMLESMGHLALGGAFVYVGVYVAPSHKRVTAYVMAGLSIACGSILLYVAATAPRLNAWAVYGGVLFLVSALVMTYSILHEGVLIPREKQS